ncbi:hypothetical protein CC1G_15253 [Coprinopsis cinerea okayama7|uniref:Uncharacterized protein n=1 Tax=Coprinopsis cinerea (strain Okayama-7 / 130 / ATCC MYA-4618 / FGSC 9003) TaxID=240176 RepID=D6RPV2_COPC7|nr:hypothetical protein CC1G_15253 [Coprinopsis cinerea okayama7\|eukprot:XP_002910345.1 hypothetical protein CC1G_15253 [Coprinopsis cinerea okayama7\
MPSSWIRYQWENGFSERVVVRTAEITAARRPSTEPETAADASWEEDWSWMGNGTQYIESTTELNLVFHWPNRPENWNDDSR